jgi:four helix bundle protein
LPKAKPEILGGEFLQFLGHAKGSLVELETQVLIAIDLAYVDAVTGEQVLKRTDEVARLISGLAKSLRSPKAKGATGSY